MALGASLASIFPFLTQSSVLIAQLVHLQPVLQINQAVAEFSSVDQATAAMGILGLQTYDGKYLDPIYGTPDIIAILKVGEQASSPAARACIPSRPVIRSRAGH